MNNYFESVLMNAIAMCENRYVDEYKDRKGFAKLYPFTTENIAGYIHKFDLEGKSLLTLGSSGDQIINSALFNCKKQTVIDICPFTKFYYYLKKAALLTLDYYEFLLFFCYKDFPKTFKDNKETFNLESFLKIKPLLRLLDYEAYLFWDELFSLFPPMTVRQELFITDEDKIAVLKKTNIYLQDEASYDLTRNSIRNVEPKFIIGDIFQKQLFEHYDNIFLSNLAQYYSLNSTKRLVDKLSSNLDDDGKMLICYLYRTLRNTNYDNDWAEIYDLDKIFELFKSYNPTLESFVGTKGILFDNQKDKDSIFVYKKSR